MLTNPRMHVCLVGISMNSGTTWRVKKLMLLGAVGFWLPDTVWHATRATKFDRWDVRGITLLMPLTLLGTYLLARRKHRIEAKKWSGWPLMAGVWLLGGLFMLVGASFSGGGFVGPDGVLGSAAVLLLSFLPPYVFIMATYDGSLGALLGVSVAAVLIWVVGHSRKLN